MPTLGDVIRYSITLDLSFAESVVLPFTYKRVEHPPKPIPRHLPSIHLFNYPYC